MENVSIITQTNNLTDEQQAVFMQLYFDAKDAQEHYEFFDDLVLKQRCYDMVFYLRQITKTGIRPYSVKGQIKISFWKGCLNIIREEAGKDPIE